MTSSRPPRPLVIAHRGAAGYEVENSLSAFRAASGLGADGVELDIHATSDGELFVHHDEVIGDRHITRSTAAEIAVLRLVNGEPVPTLEQALAAVAPPLRVFVEVKSLPPRFDGRLIAVIDQGPNKGRCAIHSFDHRIVSRLGLARPTLPRGVLLASYPIRPLEVLEDTGASVLWQERSLVDAALVEAMHGSGYQLFAWTVDEPAEMERLLRLDVDAICTNYPDVGRRVADHLAA